MMWFNLVLGLHILSVIAWMAGLLYLPRLFVYHIKNAEVTAVTDVFKVMERNLLRLIMNPAMIAAWLFGATLVFLHVRYLEGWKFFWEPWFFVKELSIVAMTGYHHFLAVRFKKLQAGLPIGSEKMWRMMNEIPFVLAIIIVLSVTLKYGAN